MKKILSYITAFLLGVLAIFPPIHMPQLPIGNTEFYVFLMILASFMGMYLLFLNINPILKVLNIFLFVSCFLSQAPSLSFDCYIVIVALSYFLIFIKKLDLNIILDVIQTVFFLEIIFVIMQAFGTDRLINFNLTEFTPYGTLYNKFRLSTLMMVIAPFLIIKNKLYFIPLFLLAILINSSGAVLALLAGVMVYIINYYKKESVFFVSVLLAIGIIYTLHFDKESVETAKSCGRFQVWKDAISDVNKKPFVGYGMGTWKALFPVFHINASYNAGKAGCIWQYQGTTGDFKAFRDAHNDFVQILWETGYIGFILILGYLIYLLNELIKHKKVILLCGVGILATTMFFMCPSRLANTVFLLIVFLGLCEKEISYGF